MLLFPFTMVANKSAKILYFPFEGFKCSVLFLALTFALA